jgi:hypothetical protein
VNCVMSRELWISHASVARWLDAGLWEEYFAALEDIFGEGLTYLDDKDPARRRAESDRGPFMVTFGPGEESRWLFAVFKSARVRGVVRHFKSLERWHNTIDLCLPDFRGSEAEVRRVKAAFDCGNRLMRPFHSTADFKDIISAIKPCTPSLDISRELSGVFWLNYFGPAYTKFFGERLAGIVGLESAPHQGVALMLGAAPTMTPDPRRFEIVERLGPESFANGSAPEKAPGRYALDLQQLAKIECA